MEEIATQLKLIIDITLAMKDIYEEIKELQLNKNNNVNYAEELNNAIDRLNVLKLDEDLAYQYFEDDSDSLVIAIDFLQRIKLEFFQSTQATIIYRRITNRLENSLVKNKLNGTYSEILKAISNSPAIEVLTKSGFTYEQVAQCISFLSLKLSNSYNARLYNTIYDYESQANTVSIRKSLISLRLDIVFALGGVLEETLMTKSFDLMPNNLNEEITPISGIDYEVQKEYISKREMFTVESSIESLGKVEQSETILGYICKIKAGLLYLLPEDLNNAFRQISFYHSFGKISDDVYEELKDAFKNIDKLRHQHNQDSRHGELGVL